MRYGKCRGCGAPIAWIGTPGGKSMPCDPYPVLYRARSGAPGKIVTETGEVLSCDLNVSPEEATGVGYISHWSTCPQAGKFKTKKESSHE